MNHCFEHHRTVIPRTPGTEPTGHGHLVAAACTLALPKNIQLVALGYCPMLGFRPSSWLSTRRCKSLKLDRSIDLFHSSLIVLQTNSPLLFNCLTFERDGSVCNNVSLNNFMDFKCAQSSAISMRISDAVYPYGTMSKDLKCRRYGKAMTIRTSNLAYV
jgi:hypothetical protein